MKKGYDTFVDSLSELQDGKEQILSIRDCKNYELKTVEAIVYSSPEKLPDGDILWIRDRMGQLKPDPWAIKIIKEDVKISKKERGL